MKVKLYAWSPGVHIRGGAWDDGVRYARCAFRDRNNPGYRYYNLGFRCCFSPLFVNDKRKDRK